MTNGNEWTTSIPPMEISKRTEKERMSDDESLARAMQLALESSKLQEESEINFIASLLSTREYRKKSYNYYIDERIDALFRVLSVARRESKSAIVNEILYQLVTDEEIMNQLFCEDERIPDILERFRASSDRA